MNLDRTDLEVIYDIIRTHLRGHAPDLRAFRIADRLETVLTADTSDNGSRPEVPCQTQYVDTAQASELLGTSERWARDLAPRIGGRKIGGRWLIPRDALPEDED